MANYDSLKNSAIEIRDEKRAGYNTAERVGRVMYNLAGAIESVDKTKQNTLSEGNGIALSGNVVRVKYGTGLEIKDGALCAKPQESTGGNVDVAAIAKQMTTRSATIDATAEGTLVLKEIYRTDILDNKARIEALEKSGGGSGTAYTFGGGFTNYKNHISLQLGSGLKINDDNDIVISIGSGIAYGYNKEILIDCGDGLRFNDNTSKLEIAIGSGLKINDDNDIVISIGSGIAYGYNKEILIDCGDGLRFNNNTSKLEIAIGSGLQGETGNKLGLKLSTALVFDDQTGAVGVDVEALRALLAGTPGTQTEQNNED